MELKMWKIQKMFVLCLMGTILFSSQAQEYRAVQQIERAIFPGVPAVVKSQNGNLFFAIPNGNLSQNANIGIARGSKLQLYKKITICDTVSFSDMIEFDGFVYASGDFKIASSQNVHTGLLRYNGTDWDTVKGFTNSFCGEMAVANNKLYIVRQKNTQSSNVLVEVDKSLNAIEIYNKNVAINNLISFVDRLYFFAGKTRVYNGIGFDSLTKNIDINYSNDVDTVMYFLNGVKLYRLNNNNVISFLDSIKIPLSNYLGAFADNSLMLVGTNNLYVHYNILSKKLDTLYGPTDGLRGSNGVVYHYKFKNNGNKVNLGLVLPPQFGLVSGRAFEDININCTLDLPTDKIGNGVYGVFNNGIDTIAFETDDSGRYSVVLPVSLNRYNVYFYNKYFGNRTFVCGVRPLVNIPTTTSNVLLAYSTTANKPDFALNITGHYGPRAKQGFTESYDLHYYNAGTTTETIGIEFNYPDSITYKKSSVNPVSHSGQKLVYQLSNIPPRQRGKITVQFDISKQKSIGGKLIFTGKLNLSGSDSDSSNNVDTLVQKVVAAHDPNAKHSNPEGRVFNPVSLIKYTIHFQNLGTDTAFNVTVVDTFVPNFPLYKVQMTGYSHTPCKLRVEPGNVLIWTFEGIKLPPGNPEQTINSGYITFEAPLKRPTQPGQIISNRAYIYFDYQKPVTTEWNKVEHWAWGLSQKTYESSGPLKIYPNPTTDLLYVETPPNCQTITIQDLTGKLLQTTTSKSSIVQLNLSSLPPGIYIISAGNFRSKVIKK